MSPDFAKSKCPIVTKMGIVNQKVVAWFLKSVFIYWQLREAHISDAQRVLCAAPCARVIVSIFVIIIFFYTAIKVDSTGVVNLYDSTISNSSGSGIANRQIFRQI